MRKLQTEQKAKEYILSSKLGLTRLTAVVDEIVLSELFRFNKDSNCWSQRNGVTVADLRQHLPQLFPADTININDCSEIKIGADDCWWGRRGGNSPFMPLDPVPTDEQLAIATAPRTTVLNVSAEQARSVVNVSEVSTKHSHYYRRVSGLEYVDVYRVLVLFDVNDPCIGHALKKLLVAGGRGGGKDISKDIQEAIDSLKRWQEMRAEEHGDTPAV